MNKLCTILPTPGESEGCQINFEDSLKELLESFIFENPDFDFSTSAVRIKASGDGAQMTRNTNLIILCLALLDGNNLSAKGNHSIAVVKGHESYEVLQESFSEIF